MSASRIVGLSDRVVAIEGVVCRALVAFLVVLILLNVTTRAFDLALYWVDELAVYAMIWMALVGASMMLRQRRHIAATLFIAILPENVRHVLTLSVDLLILAFSLGLFFMCWTWFDPIGLFNYGLDIEEFAASTYNFIYQEPTNTLGIQKYWVWSVVPVVSVTLSLHSLANFVEDVVTGGRS